MVKDYITSQEHLCIVMENMGGPVIMNFRGKDGDENDVISFNNEAHLFHRYSVSSII